MKKFSSASEVVIIRGVEWYKLIGALTTWQESKKSFNVTYFPHQQRALNFYSPLLARPQPQLA